MNTTSPPHWKHAWIVGASTGIGRDLSLSLAASGTVTAITARSAEALSVVADKHTNLNAFPGDVNCIETMKATYASISAANGPLDLVVLNAAIWDPMSVDDFSAARSIKSMQTNYGGVCNLLETILPDMKRRKQGHIAIVASVAGYRGLSQALAYAPTKAALINLAEALNLELHAHHICVSVINPGFVDTPMTARNDFPMPFMISSADAAGRIIDGLKRRRFEIAFPWQLVTILKIMRILPYAIYFPLARRTLRL